MKIGREDKQMLLIAGAMVILLVTLSQFGNAQTTIQFLDEDQSMVCKHEKHLGTSTSNVLVCVTVQDDQMEYEIFEQLITDKDTYEFD